jgi:hypothetical protein
MNFGAYLDDLPLLHSWDGGETWNTGGFRANHLRGIYDAVAQRFDQPRIIETGAGNSTLTFLHLPIKRLVTIAPDRGVFERIIRWCNSHGLDRTKLDYRMRRSEVELPKVAFDERAHFDVALIDGNHGWPTVFVDFCYLNVMLRSGSLILIDDLQIYSVAELSRLLHLQPGFDLVSEVGKLQFWEKQIDDRFLPGIRREPYIVKMSKLARP